MRVEEDNRNEYKVEVVYKTEVTDIFPNKDAKLKKAVENEKTKWLLYTHGEHIRVKDRFVDILFPNISENCDNSASIQELKERLWIHACDIFNDKTEDLMEENFKEINCIQDLVTRLETVELEEKLFDLKKIIKGKVIGGVRLPDKIIYGAQLPDGTEINKGVKSEGTNEAIYNVLWKNHSLSLDMESYHLLIEGLVKKKEEAGITGLSDIMEIYKNHVEEYALVNGKATKETSKKVSKYFRLEEINCVKDKLLIYRKIVRTEDTDKTIISRTLSDGTVLRKTFHKKYGLLNQETQEIEYGGIAINVWSNPFNKIIEEVNDIENANIFNVKNVLGEYQYKLREKKPGVLDKHIISNIESVERKIDQAIISVNDQKAMAEVSQTDNTCTFSL